MPAFDCGYNCVSVVDPIRLTFLMTIQYKSFSTDNYIFASHKSSKVECLFHENEEPSLKHATYIHLNVLLTNPVIFWFFLIDAFTIYPFPC